MEKSRITAVIVWIKITPLFRRHVEKGILVYKGCSSTDHVVFSSYQRIEKCEVATQPQGDVHRDVCSILLSAYFIKSGAIACAFVRIPWLSTPPITHLTSRIPPWLRRMPLIHSINGSKEIIDDIVGRKWKWYDNRCPWQPRHIPHSYERENMYRESIERNSENIEICDKYRYKQIYGEQYDMRAMRAIW